MNFDMFLPFRLITGEHCVRDNAARLADLGSRCLIVTGQSSARRSGALADMQNALDQAGVAHALYDQVEPNPLLVGCRRAGEAARAFGAQFIVGIGGGSPLDAAKAAAVFAANPMDDPMEIYKLAWPNRALPLVLVGTTAGTGSEVGGAAVLTTPENRKLSIVHPQTYPTLTFGDPRYTYSLSPKFTVSTALDALCHAVEGYFATNANRTTDLFALEATEILARTLPLLRGVAAAEEISHETRGELYYASVLAGFTLAHCGTCCCHPLGYYLTENYGTPHGTACAVFLADFIRREMALMPDKAERMFRRCGVDGEALCRLVEELTDFAPMQVEEQQIQLWAERVAATNNAKRTAPAGYTKEEAVEQLRGRFGASNR